MKDSLTPRERDVLRGLVDGLTNGEIANRLVIAVSTVKWYNRQIYKKLDVRNAREAVQVALTHGLLDEKKPADGPLPTMQHIIGRDDEIKQVQQLLITDPNTRLLTITGLGGMGKTTLANWLYHTQARHFPSGTTLVNLSDDTDSLPFDAALADELGLPGLPPTQQDRINSLKQVIGTGRYLFIIDNADKFQSDMLILPELLRHLPRLHVMVTARTPLQLSEETVFQLHGLRLVNGDAQALFVEEASRVRPRHVPPAGHPAVTRICQAVDGLPLGIILAAGWLRTLSVKEIADELESRLSILHSPHRDRPHRHQSLTHILQTTWQHLTAAHQQVLMGLSLFVGPFQRADMTAVTGATLADLRILVDKGSVRPDKIGYTLHPVVRRFAGERLTESPERPRLVRQFTQHILQQVIEYYERDQPAPGAPNIRAAVGYAIDTCLHDLLYEAVFGLSLYYSAMGDHRNAVRLLEGVTETKPVDLRRRAHIMLAWHHLMTGRFETADTSVEAARALMDEASPVSTGYITFFEGLILLNQGQLDAGRARLADAADLLPTANDNVLATGVNLSRGLVAILSENLTDAIVYLERASESCRHRSQRLLSHAYTALVHALRGSHKDTLYHCERGLTDDAHPYRDAAAHLTAMAALAITIDQLEYNSHLLVTYVKAHPATQVFIPPILEGAIGGKASKPGPVIDPNASLADVLPPLVTLCRDIQS